jgi:hypothetical protein
MMGIVRLGSLWADARSIITKGAKLETSKKDLEEVLDLIHDIAAKAGSAENIPPEVNSALDKIIALSRYKFNVINKQLDRKTE